MTVSFQTMTLAARRRLSRSQLLGVLVLTFFFFGFTDLPQLSPQPAPQVAETVELELDSPQPQLTREAIELVKRYESLRLKAYRDSAGHLTIGYGHRRGVFAGMRITRAQAETFLADDLAWAQDAVRKAVSADLNDNEFSALVSLAFNMGSAAFTRSRIVAVLNRQDRETVRATLTAYSKARVGRKFVTLRGLKARRQSELALFDQPIPLPSVEADMSPALQADVAGL